MEQSGNDAHSQSRGEGITVAEAIRRVSQKIADVLNIAVSTASLHRRKLRKKPALPSRGNNLRTSLRSLR